MTGSTPAHDTPRKLRAAIIGLGLDGPLRPVRILQGEECFLIGGSEQTRAELMETMLRLESELERIDRRLGDLDPDELADIAWRIDSPELEQIAERLAQGLAQQGLAFRDSTPEELTALATFP